MNIDTICFWFVFSLLLVKNGTIGTQQDFPEHENLFFIVDVENSLANLTSFILRQILQGVSLLQYRIAVYSTNGVFKNISSFQSRECLIDKVVQKIPYNQTHTRKQLLLEASKEVKLLKQENFKSKNYFIVITDDDLVSRKFNYVIRIPDDIIGNLVDRETLQSFHFYQDSNMKCNNYVSKRKTFDECQRQCDCQAGRLINCYRVRREFSKLTLNERLYYIKAYKTLYSHPVFQKRFRIILTIHGKLKFRELHGKHQILPFHRKYLLIIENLMQLLDCRITIPYWNFPPRYQHIFKQRKGYHIWDENGGFGSTDTNVKNGFCLSSGPFAYPGWKIPPEAADLMDDKTLVKWTCNNKYGYSRWLENRCLGQLDRSLNRRCVSRAINKDEKFKIITYDEIKEMVRNTTLKNYDKFLLDIIYKVHSPVHDKLGGILCTGLSSYAPEFLPFHSMLDAIWDKWQTSDLITQEKSLFYNDTIPLLWFKEKRDHYIDNSNLGNCGVKVKYTEMFEETFRSSVKSP